MINNLELKYEPETEFVYSDLNAILLGEIVEKVSGKPLDEYCHENIFEPLKMLSTTFNPGSELKVIGETNSSKEKSTMKQLTLLEVYQEMQDSSRTPKIFTL